MSGLFDNIHLGLGQDDAIEILEKDVQDLDSGSDYYMAVSHLINFPGPAANDALLSFLCKTSTESSVRLAQRKAVEVLARLGVDSAQSKIASFLDSSDIYMVENAAWALARLNCQDRSVHQRLIQLLDDPNQNQRVIIQSLSQLSVITALSRIASLKDHQRSSIRGAAIAATINLSGDRTRLGELSDHLFDSNQMDRQSAVQDVIDAGGIELLPTLLKAPVSPAFRLRAVRALVENSLAKQPKSEALSAVDQVLRDDPRSITVLHHYGDPLPTKLLVEGLFHPDFSRCYLAVQTLRSRNPTELWPLLLKCWERAKKDYGALYFFMVLFRCMTDWPETAQKKIQDLCFSALDRRWPDFIKFKPASILTLMQYSPEIGCAHLSQWLDPEKSPYWACRYAALLAIEPLLHVEEWGTVVENVVRSKEDPHRFVRAKVNSLEMNRIWVSPPVS